MSVVPGNVVRSAEITGRAAELAQLTEVLAGLRVGQGKSALLDAALAGLDTARFRLIQGRCDGLTRQFPLGVLTQALGVSELPGADQAGVLRGDPVLARVEELLELIHRMTADRPLVLVLEDMHWADEASLLVWRRLCRATPQLPLG